MMARTTGGVELDVLWAHRRRNLEAKFAEQPIVRRPAWLDDEDKLREEARLAYERMQDDWEAIDAGRQP